MGATSRATTRPGTGTPPGASPSKNADGIVAEVVFPNTVPPFFPTGSSWPPDADREATRAAPRRHPGPQPLAGRLRDRRARRARTGSSRSSSTTSTTRVETSVRWASRRRRRRRAPARRLARPRVARHRCSRPSTTRSWAGVRGAGLPVSAPLRRQRHSELRPLHRTPSMFVLETAFCADRARVAPDAVRRVRPLPEARARAHGRSVAASSPTCSDGWTASTAEW